jgi:stage II sporulation protein M
MATVFSGVWFSAAASATLFLNGVVVGAASGLVPSTTMFLAAVLPHGIIEIPSFVLAGSVGLKLGVAFLRSVRSDEPSATEEFHRVARASVYVVIGLALFFFVAGFIEGNVTPLIMKAAGWS